MLCFSISFRTKRKIRVSAGRIVRPRARQFPAPLGGSLERAASRRHSVERWPPRAKDRVTFSICATSRVTPGCQLSCSCTLTASHVSRFPSVSSFHCNDLPYDRRSNSLRESLRTIVEPINCVEYSPFECLFARHVFLPRELSIVKERSALNYSLRRTIRGLYANRAVPFADGLLANTLVTQRIRHREGCVSDQRSPRARTPLYAFEIARLKLHSEGDIVGTRSQPLGSFLTKYSAF